MYESLVAAVTNSGPSTLSGARLRGHVRVQVGPAAAGPQGAHLRPQGQDRRPDAAGAPSLHPLHDDQVGGKF